MKNGSNVINCNKSNIKISIYHTFSNEKTRKVDQSRNPSKKESNFDQSTKKFPTPGIEPGSLP